MMTVSVPIHTWYRRLPEVAESSAVRTNGLRCNVASVGEVPEARLGLQVFFQPEHALVREHPANLGVRIEQVSEHARARRTRFGARRQLAFARSVDAEVAFLHHARFPRAIAEVVLIRVQLRDRNLRLTP